MSHTVYAEAAEIKDTYPDRSEGKRSKASETMHMSCKTWSRRHHTVCYDSRQKIAMGKNQTTAAPVAACTGSQRGEKRLTRNSTHMKGEVLDSMFTLDMPQVSPLLAVQLGNLNSACNVLCCRLWQEGRAHDLAQLKVALAMCCVQCLIADEPGNGMGPFTCSVVWVTHVVMSQCRAALCMRKGCAIR